MHPHPAQPPPPPRFSPPDAPLMWPHISKVIHLHSSHKEQSSMTLLFVGLYLMLTIFPWSFFFDLDTLLRTLYLVNLIIIGLGTLYYQVYPSLYFSNRCFLSISWVVISFPISFFIFFFVILFIHFMYKKTISFRILFLTI